MSPEQPLLEIGAAGDAVRRLHALLRGAGYVVSTEDIGAATFGASTRSAVEAFQRAHGLPPSGAADAATLNRLQSEATVRRPLPGPAVGAPTAGAEIVVRGAVTLADASPFVGATVELAAQGIRGMRPLSRAVTDDTGKFTLRLDRAQLRGRGKLEDGLVAQALDTQNRILAQSDPLFHLGQSATFQLVISAQTITPPTEFARLHAAATSALDEGMTLADLTKPQIDFVARQTGFTAQQMSQLARAEQGAAQYGAPVALLYACGRQGLSAQAPPLARFPADAIRKAVSGATAAGTIPPIPATEVDAAIARLQQLNVSQALTTKPTAQSASLTDLLTLAQIPAASHPTIAAQADATGLDTPTFWQALAADKRLSADQVAGLRFTTQVAAVTGGYLPLMQDIVAARQAGRIRVAADLAQLDTPTWERLLTAQNNGRTIGAPPATPGATPTEQAHIYAVAITQALAQAFPTAAFLGNISRQGLPSKPQARDNVARFLAQNPDFELRTHPINRYLASHPNALNGITNPDAFKQDLAGIQRVFRLSPQYDHMNTLLAAGLDSAHKITRIGRGAFLSAYAKSLGQEAPAIYDHAMQIVATTTHLLTQQTLQTFEDGIPSLTDSAVSVAASKLQEELFGSLEFCACDDCRSVLSPAAYLADLLAWLAGRTSTIASAKALDVLLDRGTLTAPPSVRRPDLAGIELSCVNTNTPLPYIDLVNEILEQAVVGPVPLPAPLTVPQTTQSADELSVTPEHVNAAAYTTLAQAVFPLTLPFDLYTSQATAFLQGMKTSLPALLVATYPGDSATAYADPVVQRAELGVSALTWNILTTADPTTITPTPIQPWALWGVSGATLTDPGGSGMTIAWYVALRYVPIFLQQAGIQYTDLLTLLSSAFMQTSNLSLNPTSPCNLDTATIHNLDSVAATRAHRLLRLWRVYGGALTDLDLLLSALNYTDITSAALGALADIKRVQALLPNLSATQLATLWAPISTRIPADGSLSPYDALFQNPIVSAPLNSAFALNGPRTELATPSGAISGASNAATVLAALNLAQADLTAMLQPAGPVPDVMTLANLSALIRMATLAQGLRLSISDFLALSQLIAVSPFDGTHIANTVGWIQTAQQLLAAPLSVAQTLWLTKGAVPASVSGALSDAAISAALTTLAGNLQAAAPGADTSAIVKNAIWTLLGFPATYPLTLLSTLTQPVDHSTPNMLAYLQQLGSGALTPAQATPSIRRLQQVALLITTTGVAVSDLPYLFNLNVAVTPATTLAPGLGWLDPNALPASNAPIAADPTRLTALLRLLTGTQLSVGLKCSLQQLFSLFTFTGVKADAQTLITTFTPWTLANLQTLTGTTTNGPLNLAYPAAYQDERGMARLKACFDLTKALNATAARLLSWAVYPSTAAIAQDIRAAARAGFARESDWVAAARPWQDTLREQQRDALVGWLCGQRQSADLTAQVDATTLYDEFLIDVSMNACMMTSRIKQAISSTQLFIQRAFMNMEPLVTFTDDDHQQWLWMKNYRVWEADREVFLYPENWVLPELRDNKSPIFRDLETALLQSTLNNDNAEAALSDYLNSLYQVARLEIAGYYHQYETNADGQQINTIHVIGGAQSTPPTYYYRRYVDGSYWTAWEKIPPTIKSNHLVPIVYNRKLRLCWITVTTVKDPSVDPSQLPSGSGGPPTQWQLTLNWSDYSQGKWSPPMKADDPSQQLLVDQYLAYYFDKPNANTVQYESDFFFEGFVDTTSGDLVIRCMSYSQQPIPDGGAVQHQYVVQGDFHFAACQGTVSVVTPSSFASQVFDPPWTTGNVNQTYALAGALGTDTPYAAILGALPVGNAALDYGHQFLLNTLPAPFFFRDDQRMFFADPVATSRISYIPYAPFPHWPSTTTNPTPLPQPAPDNNQPYVDGNYPTDVLAALTSDAKQAQLHTQPLPYRGFVFYKYLFNMAYHPWVCTFIEELERGGLDALYRRWVQVAPAILISNDDHLTFFDNDYHPNTNAVTTPYPVADVDFRYGGAYALYNWELFYHAPLLVAKRLADNQQF